MFIYILFHLGTCEPQLSVNDQVLIETCQASTKACLTIHQNDNFGRATTAEVLEYASYDHQLQPPPRISPVVRLSACQPDLDIGMKMDSALQVRASA